jgi:hypothetical protein
VISGDDVLLSDAGVINFNAGDCTLTEGTNTLTIAGTCVLVTEAAGFQVGASVPFSDSSGTLTLQNVDALEATAESTIEAAIDTTANLTSIQGRTVTLADAGTTIPLCWDDVAGAYENCTAAEFQDNVNESFCFAISDETTSITTGTAKLTFRMPYAFTLTSIRGMLTGASSSGTVTIDVNDGGTTIMATDKIVIDQGEETTETAATPPALTDTALALDAEVTFDIDGAGTSAEGAKVCLVGHQ